MTAGELGACERAGEAWERWPLRRVSPWLVVVCAMAVGWWVAARRG